VERGDETLIHNNATGMQILATQSAILTQPCDNSLQN
jgi:hypothetical protein